MTRITTGKQAVQLLIRQHRDQDHHCQHHWQGPLSGDPASVCPDQHSRPHDRAGKLLPDQAANVLLAPHLPVGGVELRYLDGQED